MTDWKARCAELMATLETHYPAEIQGHYFTADLCDVLDRTRAELDQPEQEGPPKNCWKELCAELVLSRKLADWEDCEDLWARAEAELAKPEPKGLTRQEAQELFNSIRVPIIERLTPGGDEEIVGYEPVQPVDFARAVLARCCGCSQTMTLPSDIARCQGIGYEEDDGFYWRDGCEDCLRRTSPGGTSNIEPPSIIVFECEYRIDP